MPERVTVVMDKGAGARVLAYAALGPLWIIRSPENATAVESFWAGGSYPSGHLTLFDGEATDAWVISTLESVLQHHPKWDLLELVGVSPTAAVIECLGPGTVKITDSGFTFARQNEA